MSHRSPSNTGGSLIPPPKQIRFVSTDGLPQTKRRRVNAALVVFIPRRISDLGKKKLTNARLGSSTDVGHVESGKFDARVNSQVGIIDRPIDRSHMLTAGGSV